MYTRYVKLGLFALLLFVICTTTLGAVAAAETDGSLYDTQKEAYQLPQPEELQLKTEQEAIQFIRGLDSRLKEYQPDKVEYLDHSLTGGGPILF